MKLDDQSYEFSTLEKKYNEFNAPAFKIFIEGTDIVYKEYMAVEEVYVENSIDKADAFSFSVVNAFEPEKSSFKWKEKYFVVGKKIEIQLGYVDKLVTVFEGYITSIRYDFSTKEGAAVVVAGMDASFLMMKGKKSAIWLKKKHSDIVEEIAKKYKFKTEVTATSIQYETVVQNYQTDYEFLRALANSNSFEIFVVGTTLYFRKINSSKGKVVTLELSKHFIDFSLTEELAEQIAGVVVRGYNIQKEEIEGKAESIESLNSSGKDGLAILKGIDSNNTLHYIYEQVLLKNEADEIAKAVLAKNSMNFVRGEGTSIGIPEIIAGRCVEIKGMFGTQSRLFYIQTSTHVLDSEGYRTYLKFGGNAV